MWKHHARGKHSSNSPVITNFSLCSELHFINYVTNWHYTIITIIWRVLRPLALALTRDQIKDKKETCCHRRATRLKINTAHYSTLQLYYENIGEKKIMNRQSLEFFSWNYFQWMDSLHNPSKGENKESTVSHIVLIFLVINFDLVLDKIKLFISLLCFEYIDKASSIELIKKKYQFRCSLEVFVWQDTILVWWKGRIVPDRHENFSVFGY